VPSRNYKGENKGVRQSQDYSSKKNRDLENVKPLEKVMMPMAGLPPKSKAVLNSADVRYHSRKVGDVLRELQQNG